MKKLVGANWKMNCKNATVDWLLGGGIAAWDGIDVFVAVPYPYLHQCKSCPGILLGAQDVSLYESGNYTGEVGAEMLVEQGVEYVLVGHSERRTNLQESNKTVNQKLKNALKHGLKPVLCIGESKRRRAKGSHIAFLKQEFCRSVDELWHCTLDVAYEPIWAIGTGATAENSDIEEVFRCIREWMKARSICGRILYGGSVTAKDTQKLAQIDGLDGFLIGGASTTSEFNEIVEILGCCGRQC